MFLFEFWASLKRMLYFQRKEAKRQAYFERRKARWNARHLSGEQAGMAKSELYKRVCGLDQDMESNNRVLVIHSISNPNNPKEAKIGYKIIKKKGRKRCYQSMKLKTKR